MEAINKAIEDKVLDSELFLREMKQTMLVEGAAQTTKTQFQEVLAKRFEAGFAIEIIDGDSDIIERDSLLGVFNWI